ncbi:hypothetical protein Terro_2486 [Terriglobus roseus DSM 18391]|uniref:Uncharacterized protein n=1 Tax=Terriglobus roseus (strain DSM 18391 / NRRL B-41598 / KBS 63) TaxID=926566 RepID=I3ZGM6_TERRK|nr:type II toxin-antitoxin system VapB family antitoxin [Terriglobus roseus]AFL88394.1 hypothetical protein Terro_2122 [Terriglobus roseus DSM 18391]AFL88734.1 hypothetical protein Terro_2486 [Terriglobus roseus DSM 18391]
MGKRRLQLDDELVGEAMRVSGISDPSEAVEFVLRGHLLNLALAASRDALDAEGLESVAVVDGPETPISDIARLCLMSPVWALETPARSEAAEAIRSAKSGTSLTFYKSAIASTPTDESIAASFSMILLHHPSAARIVLIEGATAVRDALVRLGFPQRADSAMAVPKDWPIEG